MDYSDQPPERLWFLNGSHHGLKTCSICEEPLGLDFAIPVLNQGGLCVSCAFDNIADHPLTPTYLDWLESGDPRWWSAWICNCEGCVPNDTSTSSAESAA